MNFQEAKQAVAKFITPDNASKLHAETDQLLWIEDSIMDPAGIASTICSGFGLKVAYYIEARLDEVAAQEAAYCERHDV